MHVQAQGVPHLIGVELVLCVLVPMPANRPFGDDQEMTKIVLLFQPRHKHPELECL